MEEGVWEVEARQRNQAQSDSVFDASSRLKPELKVCTVAESGKAEATATATAAVLSRCHPKGPSVAVTVAWTTS